MAVGGAGDEFVIPAVSCEPCGGQWDVLLVGSLVVVEVGEVLGLLVEFLAGGAFGGASPFVECFSFALFAWVEVPPFFEGVRVAVGGFRFNFCF